MVGNFFLKLPKKLIKFYRSIIFGEINLGFFTKIKTRQKQNKAIKEGNKN